MMLCLVKHHEAETRRRQIRNLLQTVSIYVTSLGCGCMHEDIHEFVSDWKYRCANFPYKIGRWLTLARDWSRIGVH